MKMGLCICTDPFRIWNRFLLQGLRGGNSQVAGLLTMGVLSFPVQKVYSNPERNHAKQYRRYQISLPNSIVVVQEGVEIAVLRKALIPVVQIHNMNTDTNRANRDAEHNQCGTENH